MIMLKFTRLMLLTAMFSEDSSPLGFYAVLFRSHHLFYFVSSQMFRITSYFHGWLILFPGLPYPTYVVDTASINTPLNRRSSIIGIIFVYVKLMIACLQNLRDD
jgi:hypothetical protein